MFRGTSRLSMVVAIVAGLSTLQPVAASAAHRPAVSVAARPAVAIPKERVLLHGALAIHEARPVLIERRTGAAWTIVAKTTSTGSGTFAARVTASKKPGRQAYRAVATKVAGLTAVASAKLTLVVAQPKLAVTVPPSVVFGTAVPVTGQLTPPRRVTLAVQSNSGGGWFDVGTGSTDATGKYTLSAPSQFQGLMTVRVVAKLPGGLLHSAPTTLTIAPRTAWLADQNVSSGANRVDSGTYTINGQVYSHSVQLYSVGGSDRGPGDLTYVLGGTWASLTATVGLADDASSTGVARLEIFADNKSAWTGDLRLGSPATVSISVAGVQHLRFETSGWNTTGSAARAYVNVGNAQLSTAASAAAPATGYTTTFLEDLSPVGASGIDTGIAAMGGVEYQGSLEAFCSGHASTSYTEYDIGRAYSQLSFTFGARDDTPADGTVGLNVYSDGVLVEALTTTLGHPLPVQFPITGVLRLRLEFTWSSPTTSAYAHYATLGNARLLS